MTSPARHYDTGRTMLGFGYLDDTDERYLVLCPHCKGHALVSNKSFQCHSCYVTHSNIYKRYHSYANMKSLPDEFSWYGHYEAYMRKQRSAWPLTCKSCNQRLSKKIGNRRPPTNMPKSSTITCPNCRKVHTYELLWLPIFSAKLPLDPHYGCDLWLQTSVKNGQIWVYNENHLEKLRLFIRADHREDCGYNRSYFSRLPTWIKSAKNRDIVLKACDKLAIKSQVFS